MDFQTLLTTTFDAAARVWSGATTKQFYGDDVSVGEIIYVNLRSNPKNVLQINDTEGTTFTNETVQLLSTRIALNLMLKGVTQEDVVGVIAGNTSYTLPACYGVLFLGAPFHTLDASFNKETIAHLWKKTTPKVVFCDGNVYDRVKEVKEENGLDYLIYTLNHHIDGVSKVEDLLEAHPMEKSFRPAPISSGDKTAYILCSSGSTGLSKAVNVSHRTTIDFLEFM